MHSRTSRAQEGMIYFKYFSFIETVLFMLERRLNNLLGSTDFEVPRKTWYVIFFTSEVVLRLPLAAVFFGRPISMSSSCRHVCEWPESYVSYADWSSLWRRDNGASIWYTASIAAWPERSRAHGRPRTTPITRITTCIPSVWFLLVEVSSIWFLWTRFMFQNDPCR